MKQRPVRGVGALGVASVDSVKHLSTGVSVGIYRLFRLLWRGFADLTTGFAKAIYALVMDVGRGIGLLFAGKFDASGKWMGLGVVGFLERERCPLLVGGKSDFGFPRRLEEISLPFSSASTKVRHHPSNRRPCRDACCSLP